MKLQVDFDREKIIDFFKINIKHITCFLYSWFTRDGEVLGHILAVWHIMLTISLLTCILLSHTLYPFVWFQFGCFICLFCIWIQHIFLHVCVVINAESDFTNKKAPFYTILHAFTNFNFEEHGTYVLLVETTAVGCFFLELVGKFSLYIFDCYTKNASTIY